MLTILKNTKKINKINFTIGTAFFILCLISLVNASSAAGRVCQGDYWHDCEDTYYWSNSDYYSGEWMNNTQNGYGYMAWSSSESYEGYWENGLMHGDGHYKFDDGSEFKGVFLNGDRNGYGVLKYANGDIYSGLWQDNEKHGKGTLEYSSGRKIAGIWSMGEIIEYEDVEDTPEYEYTKGELMGVGSGFLVNDDGFILTNQHVIDGCGSLAISNNKIQSNATLIASDTINDLALIKAGVGYSNIYHFAENDPQILQNITTVGFPFGKEISSSVKVTRGIVSAERGMDDYDTEFQIDAAVQPGNSGGPVLNDLGNVVGIVVYSADKDLFKEYYGDTPEDMNFAVKASVVKAFLNNNNTYFTVSYDNNPRDKVSLIKEATFYIECFN